jgi:hypothetical protein
MIRRVTVGLLGVLWWAAAAAAQDTAGVGAIRGTVSSAAGAAVPDVAICVSAIGRCEVTDARGVFVLADLRPDVYDVEIVSAGRPTLLSRITVRAGLDAVLEAVLPDPTAIEETVVVTAPVFVPGEEVRTSGFLAGGAEIAQNAGALQDVSRFVQTLPGAAIGTDDFRNDLIVRGGSPLENLYIVDNIEIPNINTFANFASAGGTVSMIDAGLLQDVTFLTGGFPAAYGGRASSVLQLALREGDRQRTSGRLTFGFAGVGAIAEGPIGAARGSWAVSARRSFLDAVTDDTGIGGVPVLYTVNAKALYDVSARDRVWLLNVSGFDRIRLGATEDSDPTEELSNLDITYRGTRHATGFNWQRTFGARGVGLFGVTYARAAVRQRVGDLIRNGPPAAGTPVADLIANAAEVFRESSSETDLTAKYDLTVYAAGLGKVQLGGYARRTVTDYDAASPFGNEGPFFAQPEANPFALDERRVTYNSGGYAQASRGLGPRLGLTAGLRVDRFGYLPATRVSPRAGASFTLNPSLSLRLSGGRFYQQPVLIFATVFPENRTLEPFYADHLVGGLSMTRGRSVRMTVEGYAKRYRRYPVSRDVPQLSLANVGDTFAVREVLFPMISAGTGEAYGVEMFAERKPEREARWYGQANLSVSRSRYAGRDGVLRDGSFDYPVVANVTASYRLNARWDVATRVSYLAGRPYTPIDPLLSAAGRRAIYDVARVNAARSPAYFRADLRVDRRWLVNGRPLSVFAGAQNITNRKNVSGYSWDRRNGGIRRLDQLGIFPIVGLDWQF